MKKLLVSLAVLFTMLAGVSTSTIAQEQKTIEIVPTMNSQSTAQNRIWVGTFQIVWNEMVDNIIKKPVKFAGYKSPVAKELNKKAFKKTDVSDDSYYTTYGVVSPKLKETIETGIKEKFNETSDILDTFDWTYRPDKIFIYAMLKKDFKFLHAFDKLASGGFGQNANAVNYFGINEDSNKKLYKNLKVLFYNSEKDFAVQLYTKGDDMVVLYRTDDDTTFTNYFKDVKYKKHKYTGDRDFTKDDDLRIPDINLYQETSFPDVEGRRIKGTKFQIDKTIETVDFKMNNEGVELKSEAAIMMKCMAMPMKNGREFYFTDKFVLFLIEKGKRTPYYAMRVTDVETLNKTGRK